MIRIRKIKKEDCITWYIDKKDWSQYIDSLARKNIEKPLGYYTISASYEKINDLKYFEQDFERQVPILFRLNADECDMV